MSIPTNSLRHSIRHLPQQMPEVLQAIESRVAHTCRALQLDGINQVILTGSGDSYIAAMGAAPAWRAWTGLPVTALNAMDAARYLFPLSWGCSRQHTLLICVSHSGEAARVIEAAQRARAAGVSTLALSANPDSRLASACAAMLNVAAIDSASAPGTLSYCASLLGLYLLALEHARRRPEAATEHATVKRSLTELPSLMARVLLDCESVGASCSEAWSEYARADLLGSGPACAAAAYGAAKLIEASGVHAMAQDIEEFFHLNYFMAEPSSLPTVVFAPTSAASASRAAELLVVLGELERPVLWISDAPARQATAFALTLPALEELLLPLLAMVPAALLAAAWADRIGSEYYRGQRGRWSSSRSAALVRNSLIIPGIEED
jgi:glucosamine--fructose-6-phosphate aminotransferase (isomerizing)